MISTASDWFQRRCWSVMCICIILMDKKNLDIQVIILTAIAVTSHHQI